MRHAGLHGARELIGNYGMSHAVRPVVVRSMEFVVMPGYSAGPLSIRKRFQGMWLSDCSSSGCAGNRDYPIIQGELITGKLRTGTVVAYSAKYEGL